MKEITKNYSIHNLVNIKVNTKKRLFGQNVYNNPLSYFEVESLEDSNVDINLNIGEFKPKLNKKFIVDHKYYLDENYLYLKDYGRSSSWKLEISGLNDNQVNINFEGNVKGLYGLFFSDVLAFEVALKPVIELVLASKGYFLAHAGAISKNNENMLLFGMAGSLKSTIVLNAAKKGYKVLGDDKVILDIKNKLIYNFPIYHQLFDYTLGVGKEELTKIQKFKFFSSSFNSNVSSNLWEHEPVKFERAFILERINADRLKTKKLENDVAIEKILGNNKNEFYGCSFPSLINKNCFPNYMLAYSYVFPESKISNYWDNLKSNLEESFRDINFHKLEIPENYDKSTFEEIFKLIGDDR